MNPPHDLFQSRDFHRDITHALALEWRLATAWLREDVRQLLREPGFALVGHASVLGQWLPAPVREIRISLTCVVDHSWYAVVDVLKHEIAHQLADEVLFQTDGRPHGETFHQACALLGANAAASGSYPILDDAVLRGKSGQDDRIMSKIRKLLALAQSPNRNEAERAMTKARELMARHHLEAPAGESKQYVTICLGEPALRHSLDTHSLASLIRDFYFVRTIWIPMVVFRKGRVGRVLEVSGAPDSVRMAHYVFGYVQHVLESEWQRYRQGRKLGRNGRRDFALGLIKGFRGLLEKQTKDSPEIAALVRRGDPRLESYFEERHPHRRKTGAGRGIRVNGQLLADGKETARRVGLRQGLRHRQNSGRRLLGGVGAT